MNVKNILHKIYAAKDAEKAQTGIRACIGKYENKIPSSSYKLSEKDVILITYGDQVSTKNEFPLRTLKRFADTYFLPEINSIHILPFYPYTSDDGFSVVDYKKVDKNLGKWADIEALSQNYRLMGDAVINHISKSSVWFREYLKNNPDFADFFIDVAPSTNLSAVVRPRSLPLLTKFTTNSAKTKYIWTTFSEDQVDLNYKNYRVLIAIMDVLLFYVSKGVKLIRLDAVGFMWKKLGTGCMHLPEVHYIIQLFRLILNCLAPDVILVTETNVPHKENISYFGNGKNEAHMVYNFTLPPLLAYSIHSQDATKLTQWARTLATPSGETCFLNFTASHDGIGVFPLKGIVDDIEINELAQKATEHGGYVSYKNNKDGSQSPYELNCNYFDFLTLPSENQEVRIKRFLLSQAVMLAMPGIPGIYIHSLLGSQNDKKGAEKSQIKRRINREKLRYNSLCKSLKDSQSIRHKIFTAYKKLLSIRTGEQLFHPFGKYTFPNMEDKQLFAIKRNMKNTENELLMVFNFSNEDKLIDVDREGGRCLLSGEKTEKNIKIKSFDFAWIKY